MQAADPATEKVPTPQAEHEAEAAGAYAPAEQSVQMEEPADAYVPEVQVVQDAEPEALLKEPAGQAVHSEELPPV